MPSYQVVTLGCKVNHYESLQVEQVLRKLGYSRNDNGVADVVIVNTCSVTTTAAAKSRNLLRRYTRRNCGAQTPVTIAIGCWATSDAPAARAILGPSAVLTHQDNLHGKLLELLTPNSQPGSTVFPELPARDRGALSLPLLSDRQPDTQRAVLKVQDGCDAHCTYCIIPKLRPIPWHKPVGDVVREAIALTQTGHHEIVLTGVCIGAYGHSTALRHRQTPAPSSLASLIDALCTQVPHLHRLRLSSLEPGDVTDDLLVALRAHPQVTPHFHLPLQSGSDELLRRMNRQYTRDDYLRTIDRLRCAFDRPAFTTDIIVGFPGETDALFSQTLNLAQTISFLQIHAFPFSPRQGTAATRWRKQFVHQQTVTDRMHQLEDLSLAQSLAYRQQFVGETAEILIEHPSADDTRPAQSVRSERGAGLQPPTPTASPCASVPSSIRHGRCERYFPIHFELPPNSPDLTGQLARIRITRITPHRTLGQLLP